MKKPIFAEMQVEVIKYLKLRFKLAFNKEELWVLVVITDKHTGLDRPYGFNNIQYHQNLEDCMCYRKCLMFTENKQKRMDAKVHLTVKQYLADFTSFEGIEAFIGNEIRQNNG